MKTRSRTEIVVEREPFNGDRFMFLLKHFHGPPGLLSYGEMRLNAVAPENEGLRPEPTFWLDPDEAQMLLDRLYDAGLRPTREVNERSALPYISAHLEDMRRLVFERHDATSAIH